jgi:hypothetical protein
VEQLAGLGRVHQQRRRLEPRANGVRETVHLVDDLLRAVLVDEPAQRTVTESGETRRLELLLFVVEKTIQ